MDFPLLEFADYIQGGPLKSSVIRSRGRLLLSGLTCI